MIPGIVERLSKIGVALMACALSGCELLFVPKEKEAPGGDAGTDASGPIDARAEGDVPAMEAGGDAPAKLDAGTLPSCVGLDAGCGPSRGNCCASASLDGGMFKRSYDGVTFTDQGNPATVSPFALDVYETTVGRFRNFVAGWPKDVPNPGTGKNPNNSSDPGWNQQWDILMPANQADLRTALAMCAGNISGSTWADTAGTNDDLPVNCITWFEAFAFCIWDGGRLPTEAEWNFAAAGGNEQRVYPWSSPSIDPNHAVYGSSSPLPQAVGSTSPVGDGKWGHADLAGNVIEWVLDWSHPTYLNPCHDCADLTPASLRGDRGGGFDQAASSLTVSLRASGDPIQRHADVGVRCAR
jgi:formylglycine-generating enzyme required for sulfatase activity